jgi:hypothetical protein
MALGNITFVQKPVNTTSKVPVITNWTPAIGYMVKQDNIEDLFYFKLILEVRLDDASGTLLAKIKQRRNGESDDVANDKARAYFDVGRIVNTQLLNTVLDPNDTSVPYTTIHKLGANVPAKPFATNNSQIKTIYVKAYQEYSDSSSAVPTEDTDPSVNDTLRYMAASLPLLTDRGSDADYIQGTAFDVYNGNSATDLFLSDLEQSTGEYNISGYINHVRESDYHTIAFLNDNANFDSDIERILIKYYDSAGSQIGSTQQITNITAHGGANPTSATNTDIERLVYFGSGPANLQASTVTPVGGSSGDARPSNFSNWAYYTIQGSDNSAVVKTAPYYFIKQDGSCKGFNVRRLAWRNSLGCYDYFNFKMKSTQTINVERDKYNTMLGIWNENKWKYNNTQRGVTTRKTTAILRETLNTDWISEEDANLLEKLIMSTDVYVVEYNNETTYTEAVTITDSSYVKKTVANDGLIQYTINIEYANPVNTNS